MRLSRLTRLEVLVNNAVCPLVCTSQHWLKVVGSWWATASLRDTQVWRPKKENSALSHYHWASEVNLLHSPLIDLLEFILNISSSLVILKNTKEKRKDVFMKRL